MYTHTLTHGLLTSSQGPYGEDTEKPGCFLYCDNSARCLMSEGIRSLWKRWKQLAGSRCFCGVTVLFLYYLNSCPSRSINCFIQDLKPGRVTVTFLRPRALPLATLHSCKEPGHLASWLPSGGHSTTARPPDSFLEPRWGMRSDFFRGCLGRAVGGRGHWRLYFLHGARKEATILQEQRPMTWKRAERRGREGILQALEVLIPERLSYQWCQVGKRPSVWKLEFLRADLHGIASVATERPKPALLEL